MFNSQLKGRHDTAQVEEGRKQEGYQRTCHVYGQTRQYKEREGGKQSNKKGGGRRRRGVLAHLSRLWTDTQVRGGAERKRERDETRQRNHEKGSASAPVTSMDRHTSTKKERGEGKGGSHSE